MGVRRLLALVRGLPQEARIVQILEPAAEWRTQEYLLALIAELLDAANRLYLQGHGVKPGRPLMIPRPGMVIPEPPERRIATFEETINFFARRQ